MKAVKKDLMGNFKYSEMPFSWKTNTDQFQIDIAGLTDSLNSKVAINSIDDFWELFSKRDQKLVMEHFRRAAEGDTPEPIKACIATHNNSIVLCVVAAKKMTGHLISGVVIPLFITPISEDISSFFYQIFENKSHGIVITDEQTRIIACNTYFENSSGYKIDELLGQKTSIFNARKHGDVFFKEMWSKLTKDGYWNGLILSEGKTGTVKPQELKIQRLESIRSGFYYLGMTQDLSNKLYRVAGIEHGGIELLTQLPGEDEFFLKVKDTAIALNDNQGLVVISFIPCFDKEFEFESKKQLASALAYYEKDCSAGFIKKTVFSIAIVYERNQDKPHSLSIFDAIKVRFKTLRQRVDPAIYTAITECTIGCSVLGLDANNETKLLSHSLQAMYERHTSGSRNICFFNSALHEKIKRREILEDIVNQSVLNKEMEVFFQPIVNTSNWKVTKLEALCRFRDYNGNLLNTQEMIKVAEDMKLVSDLDLAIADMAISSRNELVELYGTGVELTINISLNSDKPMKALFRDLFNLFKKHIQHLPYITVELTESAYFDSEQKDCNLLFDLRKKGLKVAIDDFGTGYSSFFYLRGGNFDLLKIDKEFVSDLTVGSHNYYIVRMITQLAHTLNVEVVAEGVETLQEVKILNDLKVNYMQGYYFERPQPINKLSRKTVNVDGINALEEPNTEEAELMSYPPILTPQHTLREIKELLETTQFTAFPVVIDRRCVGVITKEQFNLHATPAMGTDRETTHEYQSMFKVASAMMNSTITRVHETIHGEEVHEKIRNKNPFPWVVINDSDEYVAIIDIYNIVHFLNANQ
ncbi:sensor domain-containing phosphodiesterase [Vibrio crassostreae]|uniref:sensor domain-containing phosphodiesterase n=1 Tax=Vibrio crassostreae TaxID=246167 RepID=UPI000639E93D|nr:EAL domain-containing protein [Vibrio crassostreae]TCO04828.1 diguanylate cyclase/phosphodiesterase [Vibrio crassostreae]CAK1987658.1 Diguanylate cyclase/phosphodiesterase [Vibrio crassostreae]CAK1989672.1 Diguanylate cyclase/phosphodiesterase [Vibrio crassostreae]CAK2014953.1 Diguanylate cyclase/phosphodiesterase [Vibrio crassostreae]CAK2238032.1 Diguanylate cyclase/phosphodiesterase [Vibrio crassostreae]